MNKVNVYDQDKNERAVLTRQPHSFIVVGKPCVGKSTLAHRLSAVWKCQLIDATSTIEQAIRDGTRLGKEAKARLVKGEQLSEEMVANIITEKLSTPEVAYYGYVLDCLPCASTQWKSVQEQIDFFSNLANPPDIIINLKIPDTDLMKRRLGQKVDPMSGAVFIKKVYNPNTEVHTSKREDEEGEEEEEDEEEEEEKEPSDDEDDDEEESQIDEFAEDLGEIDELQQLAPDIAERLLVRPEDLPQNVERDMRYYRENVLRPVEDRIIKHNQQMIIELDANLSPKDLFRALLVRLTALGLPRAAAPKRLFNSVENGESEEPVEGGDSEQLLQQLSVLKIVSPKFRWRRSRWGSCCPVQLSKGNIVQGKPEFGVAFLDKLYMLSSAEALAQFMYNPSLYLLEPNPRVPCKLCVLGPPSSGKTSVANGIAKHFDAVVIDLETLIEPALEQVLEDAVMEAKDKAMEETMSRLTAVQAAVQATQDDGEGNTDESHPINEHHPEVKIAVKAAEDRVRRSPPESTPNMYMDALTIAVADAEQRRKNQHDGRSHGGWVLDGFPLTREHWTAMMDNNLLPDTVLVLEDDSGGREKESMLLKRFTAANDLPDPSTWQQPNKKPTPETGEEGGGGGDESKPQVPVPFEVEQWKKKRSDYDKLWLQLLAAIKGSDIEPIFVDCFRTPDEVLTDAVKKTEAMFEYQVVDVLGDEEDDDDDNPVMDEGDGGDDEYGEEDEEQAARRRKPWGHTSHFCPVALKEKGVLWPGSQDLAARYRERLYCFSSEEAKEAFQSDPVSYIAKDGPVQMPPPRILLLGPQGSGKTTLGRQLSRKLGLYHVSFREYVQECIMPKMKRPPLMDPEDWEGGEEDKPDDAENDEGKEEDADNDVLVELNERESELRAYLLHNEPLSEETIEELAGQFWHQECFRSSGFVMEGFPQSGEELRYLCSKGLFPDAVVILQLEGDNVIDRLLPKKMEIWRKKRDARIDKRTAARTKVLEEWKLDKEKRKSEIQAQYDEKKAEKLAAKENVEEEGEQESEDEGADTEFEELKELLEEIEAEEPPEEEEEDEEAEEDARERMHTALYEKFDEQTEALSALQDVFIEQQIPVHNVPAGRRPHVVLYSIEKVLRRYCCDRAGLLTKCTPVDQHTAKSLLDHGYMQLSHMRLWCPVQLSDQPQTVLPPPSRLQSYPVVYHQYIIYLSSPAARRKFMTDPDRYLKQDVPGLPVPIRLAVVGPPKSGKTTVAQRFASEYGCLRLSIGEAMRRMIAQFPESELTQQMLSYLKVGQTIPDELCVLALERVLLDVQCNSRGYVLDGWPLTKAHVDLLKKYHVLPVCLVELEISDQEMLRRAGIDKEALKKPYPLHNSSSIMLIRSGHYKKHVKDIRSWYQQQHDNWHMVDGERNKWFVWVHVRDRALHTAQQIQQYLLRVTTGKAASISGLCITPQEFASRLGEYGHYCPVSLTDNDELVDCSSQPSLTWAAEYLGNYYRLAGQAELDSFLSSPEYYTGPDAKVLPPVEKLPYRKTEMEVKAMFPRQYEIKGYCPVTYVDGKKRYEALVPGLPEFSAEYQQKLFCFASEDCLQKFLRRPRKYNVTSLPVKLPPVKQSVSITSLPMLGYLEQTVSTAIINSLTAVGCVKPKFPFVNPTKSALLYVALHLKAFNPRASRYSRDKYKNRLDRFEEQCQLIGYLSGIMKAGYREPEERTGEFEYRMTSFLSLHGSGVTTGVIS